MTDRDPPCEGDLTGECVLVIEDDYYLATDTAEALRRAGARVLGPCASEEAGRVQATETPLTAALLDINLDGTPSFALASELQARGVPLVFVTGYDEQVIPAAFACVPRLQKPVRTHHIVRLLAELRAAR